MMACCLTVPSHHLKQCQLIFNYTLDNLEFELKLKKDLNENEENAFENVICKCRQFCSGLTMLTLNTLRPRQNGRHFADDMFKCIFLNENVWIPIKISLTFVPEGRINNIPALVQIMAWRRPGNKPLSEPMMVSFPTHICVTRPQWVNVRGSSYLGLTSSISWLLMPWLLTLPGHQQPWYWLYRMCRSFFYLRKDYFKYLCQINVEEWHKMQIYVYVPSEKFSM